MNIGLHAQTIGSDNDLISGSEVTTLGLKHAFEKRSDVSRVSRYGPGHYGCLDTIDLDFLIIEGWDPSLPWFIQRVRTHHPRVTVFFWNLSLLAIHHVLTLDVDGYFTNSDRAVPLLSGVAPTAFIMLAADPDEFRSDLYDARYAHNVVYLGLYHPGKSSVIIERMLFEAIDQGLAIFGYGWDRHPILKQCYQGKLPLSDAALLYSSAKVVLGMTEKRQKVAGMINNRNFEAMASGAAFISDHYPGLEKVMGNNILYARQSGDTRKLVTELLNDDLRRKALGDQARDLITRQHTYDDRVDRMIRFFRKHRRNYTN